MAKKVKRSRAIKHQDTLDALIAAAIAVVGEEGYAAASVVKITSRAKVANGTFYNYFENRQDLFDQLLPIVGQGLLDYIRKHVDRSTTGIVRERMRMMAIFKYLEATPGFLRIFHEAEFFAPKAYKQHMKNYFSEYVRALNESIDRGEIRKASKRDVDILAFLLMGMREYLALMFKHADMTKISTKHMIDVYLRLISKGGLYLDASQINDDATRS
jgi:AcrR family transcriptional regulator